MKRYIIIVSLLILAFPIQATRNQRDSLRYFLDYIGEDSITINQIIKSPEAANPLEAIETSLISGCRLMCDSKERKMGKNKANDSIYACKCAQYLTHLIINDTAIHLVETCLSDAYLFSNKRYNESLIVECAENAINLFHARQATWIPGLYYGVHKEIVDWQEKKRYYEMISFVLSGTQYMHNFDNATNNKYNRIIAEPNDSSPYYAQFRNLLDGYSDMDLARISKEQEEELVRILIQGIAKGEQKSQMTYGFMLLTGQFVKKDEKQGNEVLTELPDQI